MCNLNQETKARMKRGKGEEGSRPSHPRTIRSGECKNDHEHKHNERQITFKKCTDDKREQRRARKPTESGTKSYSPLPASPTVALISDSNPFTNFLTCSPSPPPFFLPDIVSSSTCKALLGANDEGWAHDELGARRFSDEADRDRGDAIKRVVLTKGVVWND
jgi:hypothetical protein